MANDREDGGGFGWGFFVGGLIGFVAGAYLASGPGREQVDNLRTRTIELTGSDLGGKAKAYADRARTVVNDPEHPVGKAVREGVAAARRRRQELETQSSTVTDITDNGKPEA
jgi:gas vesicle protein